MTNSLSMRGVRLRLLLTSCAALCAVSCAHAPPPDAVTSFATRVLPLAQTTGFGTTTNLDGSRLLTARHVLPDPIELPGLTRVGSREIDLSRGVFKASINNERFSILVLDRGTPRRAVRTDWAVIAPHPPILEPATPPRFAPPPVVGTRVWIIGYPDALGGTEPGAEPEVFSATVVAPPTSTNRGIDEQSERPIDLTGCYAIKLHDSHPDLSGLSGGPVLALNPDSTISIVGVASQHGSKTSLFGLLTHRWVFVAPIPHQIGTLMQTPLPEPLNIPRLAP